MGYTAYITRDTSFPFLASDPPKTVPGIDVDDWLRIVESDTELIAAGEFAVKWTGHALPFEYHSETKSICHHDPQPNVIEKMLKLATPLNAVVRGGDGEIYTTGTDFEFPQHPGNKTQGARLPDSMFVVSAPIVVGLSVMVTSDWLCDTPLVTLTAGVAALLTTFLLCIIPLLWQRRE